MGEHESLLTDKEREALELHEALPRAKALDAWIAYAALNGFEKDQLTAGLDHIRTMSKAQLKRLRKDLAAATRLLDYMTMAATEVDTEAGDHATLSLVERLSLSVASETESNLDQETDEPSQEEQPQAEDESSEPEFAIEKYPPTAIPDEPIEAIAKTAQLASEEIVDDLIAEASKRWIRESLKIEVSDNISLEDMVQKIIQIANPPASRMGKGHNGNYIDAAERVRQKLLGKTYAQISSLEEGSTPGAVQQWFAVRIIRAIREASNDEATPDKAQPSLSEVEPEDELDSDAILKEHFAKRKPVSLPVEYKKEEEEPHEALATRFAELAGFDSLQKAAFFGYINPRPTNKELNPNRERMINVFKKFVEDTLAPLPVVLQRFDKEQSARIQHLLGVNVKDGKVGSTQKFQHIDMLEYAQRNGHDTARVSESLFSALENLADMLEDALTDPAVAN